MKRKLPGDRVEDFDHVDNDNLARLRRKLARWANDNAKLLAEAVPQIPEGFHNRTRANWKLLFAIAESAGGDYPKDARNAAEKIVGIADSTPVGVELLAAIKAVFDSIEPTDVITSASLVAKLTADPESRWHEWKGPGKPLTQKQLAGLLRKFGIISGTVHPLGEPDAKGYRRQQFEDDWRRYL
jgi:hypothetical protein